MRMSPAQASELRHVSSAESREFQTEGFTAAPTSPDATSGPATRLVTPLATPALREHQSLMVQGFAGLVSEGVTAMQTMDE